MNDSQTKIKELENEISRLKELLRTDELTGIKNRRGLLVELERVFKMVKRSEAYKEKRQHVKIDDLSIIFIDCDNFKNINDTWGHEVGDLVLKEVADTIRSIFRLEDQFGRWGGEEFIVGMVGASEDDAAGKAERLRQSIESIKLSKYPKINISVSVGISSASNGAGNVEELIAQADKAMYEAKNNGKNQIVKWGDIAE